MSLSLLLRPQQLKYMRGKAAPLVYIYKMGPQWVEKAVCRTLGSQGPGAAVPL